MKVKFLMAALVSLMVLSPIASAEEGKGYRIISEKFTSTPGANGYLVSASTKVNPSMMGDDVNIKAHAFAQNQLGCPKDFNKVEGFHEVKIRNVTDKTKIYTYTYTLSIEAAKNYFERNIELLPQGYFNDSSFDYLVFQLKDTEGRYPIQVETKISGDGSDSSSHTAYLNIWYRLCK